ncbi:unnamed protein product [Phyllotreta striolata]|uniref:Kinesin motor domain-containing protein n=1 Tax=Phyllotreta striolata TaxID=444603 RepID=A0A9N9XPF4_PHYSR|nr:unnamed protein product [Phyllotreta striolata]
MTTVSGAEDARTAQKQSSPHHAKRHNYNEAEGTGFSGILQKCPPPLPPAFLRKMDCKENGVGKVKVILRISNPAFAASPPDAERHNNFLALDKRKKQVTLIDPAVCNGLTPEDRRVGVAAPKMFAFDAIFSQDDSQTEICAGVLTEVIHAVINGTDGCLFSFGQVGLGKSYTMLGNPESTGTIGIIPCAISWLFKGICEQKQKTGARFSVRVSAIEIGGPTNQFKDLLVGYSNESEQSPGVYLQDDHLFANQSPPHCELRVPNAEKAAYYLDAALDCRNYTKEQMRDSHFLYTLHIYQYSVAGKGGVAGGRSRLHLIDLGNADRSRTSGGIPLSGVGNIILSILNGQKHLPYKDNKLTQLLKECLGSVTCHTTMIAHVSPYAQYYLDTLTTVQLASRIHRMRRRRLKVFATGISNSSGGSSGEDASRNGTGSEPDPSSSDLSADTVIYVGRAEEATDGEHPPVYIPSLNSGDNRCSNMSKILKGSISEHKVTQTSRITKPVDKTIRSPKSTHRSSTHGSSSSRSPIRKDSSKYKVDATKYFSSDRSDEQWIDGPRISKSKIAEAFQLMKEKYRVRKCETWIDGPMKEELNTAYGYMDNHKKHMIKKWVEHQSVQYQKAKQVVPKVAKVVSQKDYVRENNFVKQKDETTISDNLCKKRYSDKYGKTKGTLTDEDNEDEEEPELPPALPLIQPLSSREVSIESLDQILRERLLSSTEYEFNDQCSNNYAENEVMELIEVEEPSEPVPMQDQCLQVTEEDINSCMGQTENPLPEVDQQSLLGNSLRCLSEENLSGNSSFADSVSIFNELERILPRGLDLNTFFNDYEDIDNNFDAQIFGDIQKINDPINHKLFCTGAGKSEYADLESPKDNYLIKSYKSMTLTDILCDQQKQRHDDSSIYSEPIYLQERFCENCKANMSRSNALLNEYRPFFSVAYNAYEGSLLENDERFQRFNHMQRELSELRQPDGASNPHLEEENERHPGNGACSGDTTSDFGKSESLVERLYRSRQDETNFATGIEAIKLKHKHLHKSEDDSLATKGYNSSPSTSFKRVEPVTEISTNSGDVSYSKSESGDISISHTRRKCKHNHNKSFCSWFLNPFTCKYENEAKETHL